MNCSDCYVGAFLYVLLRFSDETFLKDKMMNYQVRKEIIVRAEGEKTLTELVKNADRSDFRAIDGISFRHKGEIIHNSPRSLIESLDELPYSARFYGSWRRRLKGLFSSNDLKRRAQWYMANRALMTQLEALF